MTNHLPVADYADITLAEILNLLGSIALMTGEDACLVALDGTVMVRCTVVQARAANDAARAADAAYEANRKAREWATIQSTARRVADDGIGLIWPRTIETSGPVGL